MTSSEVDANGPIGRAILQHAFSDGGKVLEFKRTEEGELRVLDVTEHHKKLQEFHDRHN